jgi:hypothetical protein
MNSDNANSELAFSDYISYEIEHSSFTQHEIANKLGLNSPNVVCMYKQQTAKVPLKRVPDLARILGLDPAKMLRLAFYEYHPETAAIVEKYMGRIFKTGEVTLMKYIASNLGDIEIPRYLNKDQASKLNVFLDSLKP